MKGVQISKTDWERGPVNVEPQNFVWVNNFQKTILWQTKNANVEGDWKWLLMFGFMDTTHGPLQLGAAKGHRSHLQALFESSLCLTNLKWWREIFTLPFKAER
jgi:hypothetical protein